MELPAEPEGLVAELLALLRAEGFERDAYIRALAFFGDQSLGVRLHGLTPELALVALPATRYIEKADGAHVTFSSWVRIDDNVIPPRGKIAGGYVNSALAKSDAELAGFDEALMLNRSGQLSEGSAENVFLVRRGRVLTPAITGSILEGITRRSLIELMRGELGLDVEERAVDRSEVYLAEEVFLAGTAVQVVPVTRVDHRRIGDGRVGPVTRRVEELYDAVLRGGVPARRDWCEPVYARKGEVRCA
jgi:branched-chain amino acid aminotransferase